MLIPRIMHTIWLGKPLPDHLRQYVLAWREMHPDWTHLHWTERALGTFEMRNRHYFDEWQRYSPKSNQYQYKSNLWRYEIVERYGGVYVDCDLRPLKPLDDLLDGVHAFAGRESAQWVNNCIIGAVPHHPLLQDLVNGAAFSIKRQPHLRSNSQTGAQYLTAAIRRHRGVVVFPPVTFSPYRWDELERDGDEFPSSYAVHTWNNRRTGKRGR